MLCFKISLKLYDCVNVVSKPKEYLLYKCGEHLHLLQGLDDLNVEDDTKDLINREIRSFRNLHKVTIYQFTLILSKCSYKCYFHTCHCRMSEV